MGNIFGGCQIRGQKTVKFLKIFGNNFQQKIGLTSQHMARAHQRPTCNLFFKGNQVFFRLGSQAQQSKDGYPAA